MAYLTSHWRVYIASILAIVFICAAFVLAQTGVRTPVAEASTESALLQAIATKDTDGDGLPDWEEALYGTSATVVDTNHLGMSDGEAVAKGLIVPKAIADISLPDASSVVTGADGLPQAPADNTLTATFAKHFLELYSAAKQAKNGEALSESEMKDIANQAFSTLSSVIVAAPDYKSAADLSVVGTGAEAMMAFAERAGAVFMNNTSTADKSEMLYLQDALQKNDTTALSQIAAIAKVYRGTAAGLSALTVPQDLATDYLALINAMMRMSEIATDFTRVNDDPLAAMLALQQYPVAAEAMAQAFIHIAALYKNAGVVPPSGTPGASFVNVISDILSEQAAEAAKTSKKL